MQPFGREDHVETPHVAACQHGFWRRIGGLETLDDEVILSSHVFVVTSSAPSLRKNGYMALWLEPGGHGGGGFEGGLWT